VQNDREWRRFCACVMQAPGLANDKRFSTNAHRLANREALESLIAARFRDRTTTEVLERLQAADIPTGTVNDVAGVARHPQLAARNRWTTVSSPGGEIPALVPPHNLQGVAAVMGPVPALGQHTVEVMTELGVALEATS
jgi:itaconate CoA-transferase